jgi:hypothetical protein
MQTVAHDFQPRDYVGGHVALDFTNTVTARDTTPLDWTIGRAKILARAAARTARTRSRATSGTE